MKDINLNIIGDIIKKHNQNIYDNVTPKSALLTNCIREGLEENDRVWIERLKEHEIRWKKQVIDKILVFLEQWYSNDLTYEELKKELEKLR